jgi:TonB-linked SusC/RagA family outer membrane protein
MKRKQVFLRSVLLICFSLFTLLTALAQSTSVKGKVVDENNKPMVGVTVSERGTTKATTTKDDGSFELAVSSARAILILTYVGYQEQELRPSGRSDLTLSMQPAINSLRDVVVVGYGTQRKSDITGALSRMTAEDIQERPAQNILNAMQGKAAGVHITTNFKPGELPIIRVRGNRSLRNSSDALANSVNDPLYVVDGIPLVNALGVNSFTMSDINPNDIVSIEVLKDASATAIYGSRGANGVVLITTNKGKKGRLALNYSSTVSFDKYHSLTDWMDGGQYVDRWREALINGRGYQTTTNTNLNNAATPWFADPFLDRSRMSGLTADPIALNNVWAGYEWRVFGTTPMMQATTAQQRTDWGWPDSIPVYNSRNVKNYDWVGDATRTGITQSHQISLSAGSDISRMAISLGYYDQKGVQVDQDYKRYTASLSGDITATEWFTLGTSILASFSVQNYGIQGPNTANTGSKDLYSRALDQFPYAQPTDANGTWIRNAGGNLGLWNPIIDINQNKNERRSTAVMASVFAEIKFTPWLKYRVNFGPQFRQYRNGTSRGPLTTNHMNANSPNFAAYATEENFSWVIENLLYVDKTFAKIHRVGLTLLQSSQKSRRESVTTNVQGMINPFALWYDLGANTQGNPQSFGSAFTENTLTSFMGRFNYTLMDKYLITGTIRADAASVLAPGHQWNYFPSFAIAWKAQEESFLRSVTWLNELKPRIGYGVTGSSTVSPYTSSGPLSRNPYVFGTTVAIGYLPQTVRNPVLGWERTSQLNTGLDFSIFGNRVSGSVEYYIQNTTDLLLTRALPGPSGYVTKLENVGQTRNKGVEITISGTPVQRGDFTWSVDLNWSRNREEIVELINGKTDMLTDRWFIGSPLQVYYNYESAGVWGKTPEDLQAMAAFNANGHRFYPGTVKVVDQNKDNRINASDMVILGTPRPSWTGGITNTLRYKNWSFNMFVYFRWGQKYFGGYPNSYGGTFPNGRVENDIWTWTKGSGRWPMANTGNVENFTAAMQYNDGSFGAIRNISISYQIPKKLLSKLGVRDIVLNAQMLNPLMFGGNVVKWGINPEDDTNWSIASSNTNPLGGVNNNTILPQSFVVGIRAGF